jgi:hypothetical protein
MSRHIGSGSTVGLPTGNYVAGDEVPNLWKGSSAPGVDCALLVGRSDAPCVIVMAGARSEDEQLRYPVSELAARYGASAEEETSDFKQAYARFGPSRRERPSYWDRL